MADNRFDIVAALPDEQWVAHPLNQDGEIPPQEIIVLSKAELQHALPRSDATVPPTVVKVQMSVQTATLNVRDAPSTGKVLRELKRSELVTIEAAPIVKDRIIWHKLPDKAEYCAERTLDGSIIYLNPT